MAYLKPMHKYQLKLLALNSTMDTCLKELLPYFVSKVTSFEEKISQNVNQALSGLLKSTPTTLMEMHFVTTYPAVQGLIYTDLSTMEIRDEIRIEKLDACVICDILLHQADLRIHLDEQNLTESLENLKSCRILVATENSNVFWERFDSSDGIKLSFNDELQTWGSFWQENKQSVIKMMKFLKEKGVLKEKDYTKHFEDLNLFSKWSKQEMLRNWYRQLNQQCKSVAFLQRVEKQLNTNREVDINIRVVDRKLTLSDNHNTGWLESVVTYITSFFSSYVDQVTTTLHDYELDGEIAKRLSQAMKDLVVSAFGVEGFMEIVLYKVTKGIQLFDEDEDTVIPLIINIENEEISLDKDPFLPSSLEIWSEIEIEIKNCIKEKMGIPIFCIRTTWDPPKKLHICVTKSNSDSWHPAEVSGLIEHLVKWKFPYKISVNANPEVLENIATMTFKMSTTNANCFGLMEKFSERLNERTSTVSVNYQNLKTNDIIETLGLADMIGEIQKSTPQLTSKRDNEDLESMSDGYSLRSSRSDGGSSSCLSTPRISLTPRLNDSVNSLYREPSTLEQINQVDEPVHDVVDNNTGKGKPPRERTSIQQHSSIPKRKQQIQTDEEDSIDGNKNKTVVARSQEWIKLEIIKKFLLKPALLSVLHNDNNIIQSSLVFPRDPKKMYESIKFLQQKHPRSFDIWRKSELNAILLPNDGTEESHSDLWSIDMVYFVLRTSNMLPPPKNGRKRASNDTVLDEIAFCCLEVKTIKNEIDQGRIEYVDEAFLERVGSILKRLGYENDIYKKLKDSEPIEQFFC